MTEESIWSILGNKNGVVITMITELDEQYSGFDGAFKSSIEKLIHIRNLLPLKATESVVYDVIRSYE